MLESDRRKGKDPSNAALSYILKKYSPNLWYFGHWHASMKGMTGKTRWFALNMAADSGWWRRLDNAPEMKLDETPEEKAFCSP